VIFFVEIFFHERLMSCPKFLHPTIKTQLALEISFCTVNSLRKEFAIWLGKPRPPTHHILHAILLLGLCSPPPQAPDEGTTITISSREPSVGQV
jgi:hypothetical protein